MNGGQTFYCRLVVPPEQRPQAGKTRLIRSLGTTDHGEALKRYGAVYAALERELEALLAGDAFRQKVASNAAEALTPDGIDLPPAVKAELALGVRDLEPDNPVHQAVFNAIQLNEPLRVNWDEAVRIWEHERNRIKSRPVSQSSIYNVKRAVDSIRSYGQPHQITKHIIRRWTMDMEVRYSPVSVANYFRLLSAVMQCLVDTDALDGSNPFKDLSYVATQNKEDEKRSFTDDEMFQLMVELPEVYWMCMTGMRPGEFASRLKGDVDGGIIVVDDQPSMDKWRPKTLSSYRRVPIPAGFELDLSKRRVKSRISNYSRRLSKIIPDPLATAHSGRHTFYELSRRAGCDSNVIETVCGHAKVSGSRSAKNYGSMPDEVLIRESQKVWDFVAGLRV